MINLNEAVIVEGKYDKIKLSSFIDALIITTNGFRIFKNKQKRAWIKDLAKTRGIIILTDSDRAGQIIRN
ncbi:MAG: toprim domain-containing protein, partial [Oscillospiraceae bacterium]|nr:toprim domain-containing protein [Oscillospiraceae bacterium]